MGVGLYVELLGFLRKFNLNKIELDIYFWLNSVGRGAMIWYKDKKYM